ncbi:GntR family transcriptional regulator [Streptomyces sp. NPDC014748]|uniref:GntR family transcriptional regulator n=1 Tax=unclassified Streptomyces TaxID=2593676 RepID=UPI001469BD6D|nr:UTRA domain-containing protein [Streptomyces sp. GMY02]NMO37770.1 UTRA domain-containing protein [Streptomyces sp. GMY02]
MSDSTWVSVSTPYLTPRPQGKSDAWAAEAAARGGKGSQRIVHAGEVPAPDDVAALFGLPAGETVVVRRRVIELDDCPTELTDTYYPLAIAGGTPLAQKGKIRGGAVTLLAELGYSGARVREDVTARMPSPAECEALRMPPDQPVLRLSRVTFDKGGRPIQVDRMLMPAHRQQLRYEMRIG